jgi:hypothetical protein
MKLAILLSGRVTRYEVCLIPILEKCSYDVDLFISVNNEECAYFDILREKLKKWLKGLRVEKYVPPADFECEFIPNDYRYNYQCVDNKWIPRNQLSMYYNDMKAFQMAITYADSNKFEYDYFMRFRADLFDTCIPTLPPSNRDELMFYSIYPLCYFTSFCKHKVGILSADWVWGNRKTMSIYCETYNYVLEQNKLLNGKYIFHYESNVTDCILDKGVPFTYVHIRYKTDNNRRIFDENFGGSEADARHPLKNSFFTPIKTVTEIESFEKIPPTPE